MCRQIHSREIWLDIRVRIDHNLSMKKLFEANGREQREQSASELVRLIERLLDGIDGYECEHGDLRYWNRETVEVARRLVGSPETV